MDDLYQSDNGLRALAMRVAALEDNVAFLERWCEEQQDILDRTAGPIAYEYEREPRQVLRIVDLRDARADEDDDGEGVEYDPDLGEVDTVVAIVETDHDRPIHQLQD